jgi:hypothetical protein
LTREQSAVLGCVTGARALAARLVGERADAAAALVSAAADASAALARGYAAAGVGALLIAEEAPLSSPEHAATIAPVGAVAREFGIPLILLARHPLSGAVEDAVRAAGADRIAAPGGRGSVCAMPSAMLLGAPSASDGWFRLQRDAKPAPRLFVSEWEVPVDSPLETLVALRDKVVA